MAGWAAPAGDASVTTASIFLFSPQRTPSGGRATSYFGAPGATILADLMKSSFGNMRARYLFPWVAMR